VRIITEDAGNEEKGVAAVLHDNILVPSSMKKLPARPSS
jgi:hypothetical protein